MTGPEPTASPVTSVSVQANDGVALSSDRGGVAKVWDISTGLCKASFNIPVEAIFGQMHLCNGKLIVVWRKLKWYIWNSDKGQIKEVDIPYHPLFGEFRISGDGSKIIILFQELLMAWSIQTKACEPCEYRTGQISIHRSPYHKWLKSMGYL